MPFRVQYDIYDGRHKAPVFTSYNDRKFARIEYDSRTAKDGPIYRMAATVTPFDLTKQEEYLYLVYEVRRLQRRYFKTRNHEDLVASLTKETELDKWIARTQSFMQSHPWYQPTDAEAHLFFLTVQQWRIHWKDYFKYKKSPDADPRVTEERKKQCFDFEKKIDEYIHNKIFV